MQRPATNPLPTRPLELLRWLPLELQAGPLLPLALLATAGLWVSIWLLSRYGLASSGALSGSTGAELAFLSATIGAAVACQLLGRRAWLVEQLAPRERKVAVFLVFLVLTLVFQVAGLALPALLTPSGPGDRWIAGGFFAASHWAALGLCAFALPLAPSTRTLVLLFLGWWLPALLATGAEGWWGARVRWILDPARYLVLTNGPTSGASLVDMAPVAALLLVAASLPFHARHRR